PNPEAEWDRGDLENTGMLANGLGYMAMTILIWMLILDMFFKIIILTHFKKYYFVRQKLRIHSSEHESLMDIPWCWVDYLVELMGWVGNIGINLGLICNSQGLLGNHLIAQMDDRLINIDRQPNG
ncbi:hypothetical protein ACJX0J_020943, partial [Zea mays]